MSEGWQNGEARDISKSLCGGINNLVNRVILPSKSPRKGVPMTIAEIKDAIQKLNREELSEICSLVNQLRWDDWDRQIACDYDAGRLDFLIREADEALNDQDIQQWP